jgi:hypothetical protein
VLFRGRGMKRCPAEGRERFEPWVAAAVLAKPHEDRSSVDGTIIARAKTQPDIPQVHRLWWHDIRRTFLQPGAFPIGAWPITTKADAKIPRKCAPSSRPGFIGEMTRPNTNDGVSRQKLN